MGERRGVRFRMQMNFPLNGLIHDSSFATHLIQYLTLHARSMPP